MGGAGTQQVLHEQRNSWKEPEGRTVAECGWRPCRGQQDWEDSIQAGVGLCASQERTQHQELKKGAGKASWALDKALRQWPVCVCMYMCMCVCVSVCACMSVCDTCIWMREEAGGWGAGPNPEPLLVPVGDT